MPKPDLLIVGGSARAAAWCAVRAGLRVAALDRYNDLDLLAVADPVFRWDGSDRQVEEVVGGLGVPWTYTGPLENRPDLIARCERLAPLRGNGADVLRAARDPVRLQRVLAEAGLPALAIREERDAPPANGAWLLKPRAGCGGRGVAVWDDRAAGHPTLREPHYFQEYVPPPAPGWAGASRHSLGYAAEPGGVRLLGKFGQPDPSGGRFPFRYGGVSGPTPPNAVSPVGRWAGVTRDGRCPPWFEAELEIAPALAEAFGLIGPFGIDLVARGDVPCHRYAVEVNPRLTAGMELCAAAAGPFGTVDARDSPPSPFAASKVVIQADRPCRVARPLPVFGPHDADAWVADVPAVGTVIPAGGPVCTVFHRPPDWPDADSEEGAIQAFWEAEAENAAGREARVRSVLEPV